MELKFVFLGIFFILIIYFIICYNKAVSLKNYVREAFSTMDVYLKKRWDLIPNLVEVVKAYAKHEKEVFQKVTELRTKSYNSLNQDAKLNANIELNNILPKFIAIAEDYPEVKANEHFIKLMDDLNSIEDDIVNARKYYNGTVREFNNFLEIFPTNIIGTIMGFKTEKMFEIDESQKKDVKVDSL